MRAILQRVDRASVTVEGADTRSIGRGLVVLVAVAPGDGPAEIRSVADKVLALRVFASEDGVKEFDRSVRDVDGGILVVSQFTLYADVRRGRRPDFSKSAPPDAARPVYAHFVEYLRSRYDKVKTGEFGAMMDVQLVNHGPVTLLVDSAG